MRFFTGTCVSSTSSTSSATRFRRAVAGLAVVLPALCLSVATASAQVSIYPGDSIQAAVNANPEGTSFVIKQGVHRRQTVRPKHGMSFIGEAGAVLDGEKVAARAFIAGTTRNVTIRGLRITQYVPPNTGAAVDGIDGTGWLVEGNEIDHNINGTLRAYGLRIGSSMIVRGNKIHHNGWVGISGYKSVDTLIENNEIYNNPAELTSDTIGEAANIKLFECGRIIARNNHVHDGAFRGIWFDTSAPDMTIEGNRVINHGDVGIWHEVSYRGTIRNNYVENAGYNGHYGDGWLRGGGILVSNSPDVSILNNTVVNSLNGIVGHQAASYVDGPYGANQLRNLLVRDNTIVMSKGQSGISQNIGSSAPFVSWNNHFDANNYQLGTNAIPFHWMDRDLDEHAWQAQGQGINDTYDRTGTKTLMALDSPTSNATTSGTLNVAGWAIDGAAASGTGVDAVHVYAYPSDGGPERFLGAATYGVARPDVGAVYGSKFTNAGYQLSATLTAGTYQIVAYAHSTVAGTFNATVQAASVTVQAAVSRPIMALDTPTSKSGVAGQLNVAGWAADIGAPSGTGVSAIHVWAFPASGSAPVFLGPATYGGSRPDVGAFLGDGRFANSGYTLSVNTSTLSAGTYDVVAYAFSTVAGTFNATARATKVAVQQPSSRPQMFIDTPGAGIVSGSFQISGWVADFGAPVGTGIDAVHIWAFPTNGGAAIGVGVANYGQSRPDVAAAFRDQRFTNSGYELTVGASALPSGTYDLVVFGRTTTTNTFSVARVVRITRP